MTDAAPRTFGARKSTRLQDNLQDTRRRYDVLRRKRYACACCPIQDRFRGTFQCRAGENSSSRSNSRCRFFITGARNIGISYRRAWLLVQSLNQSFRRRVTVANTGGRDGGGMLVTEFGGALIKSYRKLERDFASLAERRLHAIIATVIRHSKSGAKVSVRTKLG